MFTQNCFIRKNTHELRERLRRLGQRANTLDDFKYEWIAANYGMFISVSKGFENLGPNDVDCGTNEELFLAIAALRDDSDKYQWFINKKGDFCYCFANKFSHFRLNTNDILNTMEKDSPPCFNKPFVPYADTKNWHKATVQELIEHFEDK